MPQNPPAHTGYQYRNGDADNKAVMRRFQPVDDVHSVNTRYQRGGHEHDVQRGKRTHGRVHVVVDNAGIRVHCRLKDVRIDIRRLASLRHFNAYVFDKVGIQLVNLQLKIQFVQQVFVAAD